MRHQLATSERPLAATGAPMGPAQRDFAFEGIIGQSRTVRSTIDYLRRLAADEPGSLLLVGGPGTGKTLFARAFHYASERAHQPFLQIHCRTTSEAMLETELFGYEAGAFEGANERKQGLLELAGTGTVFIADIAALPPRLQPKLLRALASRRVRRVGGRDEYDIGCSIVVGCSRPLEELVAEGTFREDLLATLSARRVSLPSLTEREDDVLLLAQHFLARTVKEQGLLPMTLAPDALHELMDYEWPGNARELERVVRMAAERSRTASIHAEDLSIQRRELRPMIARSAGFDIAVPHTGRSLRDIEAEAIRNTLDITGGNRAEAARILQISASTLARKIDELGMGSRGTAVSRAAYAL